jgi:hypothetical protein
MLKGGAQVKKGMLLLAVIFCASALLSGCATPLPTGWLYTEVRLPSASGSEGFSYSKTGESVCTSILSLVATGDCSIKAAMTNGKVNKVKYVDYSAKNILGIYGEYTTTVYGD